METASSTSSEIGHKAKLMMAKDFHTHIAIKILSAAPFSSKLLRENSRPFSKNESSNLEKRHILNEVQSSFIVSPVNYIPEFLMHTRDEKFNLRQENISVTVIPGTERD